MNTTPQSENPYASPQSEETPVVSNPTPAWRDGELVVVAPDGELPRRCAKCGGEASGGLHYVYLAKPEPTNWARLAIILAIVIVVVPVLLGIFSNMTIPWPPWLGKFKSEYIFLGIAATLIVLSPLQTWWTYLSRRPKSLRYSTCFWHGIATKVSFAVFHWVFLLFMIPSFLQLFLGADMHRYFLTINLIFVVMMVVSTRFTFTAQEVARRNDFVWLKGAGQAFRDSLPEFPPELAIKQSDER